MKYLIPKSTKMNYLLLMLVLFVGFSSNAQNDQEIITSKLICKTVDEFTDKVSVSSIDMLIGYEDGGDMKTQGMLGMLFLNEKEGKIKPSSFYLKVLGIKGCVDKESTLDVIFENGEKTQLVNWKEFNCEAKNYFNISGKEDLFKSSKIKAVKYTNKRNYSSMIIKDNMDKRFSEYLMNILLEIDKINNAELTVGTCKD